MKAQTRNDIYAKLIVFGAIELLVLVVSCILAIWVTTEWWQVFIWLQIIPALIVAGVVSRELTKRK